MLKFEFKISFVHLGVFALALRLDYGSQLESKKQ
jgi:hypothetical protein